MRYLEDGDYEEAIVAFSAAIQIDGNRPEAYVGRADAYRAIGETAKALKDYKKAKRIARKSDEDYDDLIDELDEIIEELEEMDFSEIGTNSGNGAEKLLTKVVRTSDSSTGWSEAIFTYDQRGLVIAVEYVFPSADYGDSNFECVYDEAGRLTEIWTSFSKSVGIPQTKYHYDENGFLTEISGVGEGGGIGGVYENDPQGRPIRYTAENDFSTEVVEYTYGDNEGEVYAVQTHTANDGSYSYEEQIVYTYDEEGRLLSELHSGTAYWYRYTYSYDCKPFVVMESEGDVDDGYGVSYLKNACYLNDSKGHTIWAFWPQEENTMELDEDGYLSRILCQGERYEFLYDDTPSGDAGEEPAAESGNAGALAYDIVREDRSQYRDNGTLLFEHYYDCVVLRGNTLAVEKINAAIREDMEGFLYTMDEESLYIYTDSLPESSYVFATASAEVTDNSGTVFSICVKTQWFMGGVVMPHCYGLNFDARTGEPVYLPELYGMEEVDFLSLLKDTCWAYLIENHASDLWNDSHDTVYGYSLSDFFYYFQDGQLMVVFSTYSISYGAKGCITVPTGLYY